MTNTLGSGAVAATLALLLGGCAYHGGSADYRGYRARGDKACASASWNRCVKCGSTARDRRWLDVGHGVWAAWPAAIGPRLGGSGGRDRRRDPGRIIGHTPRGRQRAPSAWSSPCCSIRASNVAVVQECRRGVPPHATACASSPAALRPESRISLSNRPTRWLLWARMVDTPALAVLILRVIYPARRRAQRALKGQWWSVQAAAHPQRDRCGSRGPSLQAPRRRP